MKYERLLQKKADNPEWWAEHHARTLELQRIRYLNPAVRERHRLALIKSRERKALGLIGKLPQAEHVPVEPIVFREAPFECKFD